MSTVLGSDARELSVDGVSLAGVLLASVVAVALGLLLGVDVFGWDEVGVPVGGDLSDLPGAVVDHPVVVAAQQYTVVQAGRAAVCPVGDVVAVAPAGWPVAAGEGAAAVAQDQGAAEGSGEQAALLADVEDLAGAAEDGG
jgi:hypothetical protein